MKKTATALIVAFLAVLVQPVSDVRAQWYDEQQLAKIKQIRISVSDGVKDACLPRPNILKTEAELILRRSGIHIKSDGGAHMLDIDVLGLKLASGHCVSGISRRSMLSSSPA